MEKRVIIIIAIITVILLTIIMGLIIYKKNKGINGESLKNEVIYGYCEKEYTGHDISNNSYTRIEPMLIKSTKEFKSKFLKVFEDEKEEINQNPDYYDKLEKFTVYLENNNFKAIDFFNDDFFNNYNIIAFSYSQYNCFLNDIIITKVENNKACLKINYYWVSGGPYDWGQRYVFVKVDKNIQDIQIEKFS